MAGIRIHHIFVYKRKEIKYIIKLLNGKENQQEKQLKESF